MNHIGRDEEVLVKESAGLVSFARMPPTLAALTKIACGRISSNPFLDRLLTAKIQLFRDQR